MHKLSSQPPDYDAPTLSQPRPQTPRPRLHDLAPRLEHLRPHRPRRHREGGRHRGLAEYGPAMGDSPGRLPGRTRAERDGEESAESEPEQRERAESGERWERRQSSGQRKEYSCARLPWQAKPRPRLCTTGSDPTTHALLPPRLERDHHEPLAVAVIFFPLPFDSLLY